MMYYNTVSEGLTAAAIFLFLIPDQKRDKQPWTDTTDSKS